MLSDTHRKLTKKQINICERLRKYHAARKPLNIHAIKRRHPKLLETVYAIKPFWGWKNALSDAGIDYGSINVELDDWIECQICGQNYVYLSKHLEYAHQTTPSEYQTEFPGASLMSETMLASRFRQNSHKKPLLPHWEPIWSEEYVLDRVFSYYEMGQPINARSMTQYDYALLTAARSFLGSWGAVLERIGLDPKDIHIQRPNREHNRESIIAEIQRRHLEGLPINSKTLQIEDPGLFVTMRKIFGSHRAAVTAAGICPDEIRLSPRRHNEADYHELMEAARRVATIEGDQRGPELHAFHQQYLGTMLSYCKNWTGVANAAGVPPHRLKLASTEEDLFDSLDYWAKKKRKLSGKLIEQIDPLLFKKIRYHAASVDDFIVAYHAKRQR